MAEKPVADPMSLVAIPWRERARGAIRSLLPRRELGVLIALFLVVAGLTLAKREFFSLETFGGILTVSAELGVVALGVTLLMIGGEFDLSVGANFAMTGMLLALFIKQLGWNQWLSFPMVLGLATLVGLLNGAIMLATRMPSFIATLGTLMLWRGIGLFLTGGWPVSIIRPPPLLQVLGGERILALGSTIHVSVIWWLALIVVFWIILEKTRYGNWTFATGGKREAARALGVPVNRVKLTNFALVGLVAGLAGCLQLGRMGSMSPVWGEGLELEAIAAAVVGGASLRGGVGTILGTVLGTITISAIRIGLVMAGAPAYWYRSFLGVTILIAVAINVRLGERLAWRK